MFRPRTPAWSPRRLLWLAVALFAAASPACRCGSNANGDESGASASTNAVASAAAAVSAEVTEPPELEDGDDASSEAPVGDAANRFRDAEPRADVDLGGPPDPACTGAEIVFASAVVDARCAVSSSRAKKLRALLERDGARPALRQEAKVGQEGRIVMRLVNEGRESLTLPLLFHAKLPAFTALAEDERHTLYELEAPLLELHDPGQGNRSHVARIVLPPGGAAVATLSIATTIRRVLGRGPGDPCKDGGPAASGEGGPCNLTRLPKGRYVLHLGELLSGVEAGAPARVTWDLP